LFPIAWWSSPIDLPSGRGVVVAFTDITERQRVESAARERDAATIRAAEAHAAQRRIMERTVEVRRRVARDLHDGAQQRLVALLLHLELARAEPASDDSQLRTLLDGAVAEAQGAIDDLRELAAGLHPSTLERFGLTAAIQGLADRMPLASRIESSLTRRLSSSVEASADAGGRRLWGCPHARRWARLAACLGLAQWSSRAPVGRLVSMTITTGAAGKPTIVLVHGALVETLAPVTLADGSIDLFIRQDRYHVQFAADSPAREAAAMTVTQRPIVQSALTDASGEPAWRTVPSWFLFGTEDKNIPAAAHRFMAERAGSRRTVELQGGSHTVGIPEAAAVADLIREAAIETAKEHA
jgi:pimeloyl-ACP methyl ester carboxylesterase